MPSTPPQRIRHSVVVNAPAYAVIGDGGLRRWTSRRDLDPAEDDSGARTVDRGTRSVDGGVHKTRSHRAGQAPHKRVRFPPVMSAHTGRWNLSEVDDQVPVTSRRTVLRPDVGTTRVAANSPITPHTAKRVVEAFRG